MTHEDRTATKTELGWVDGFGIAAAVTITAGVGFVWGIGWALIALGAITGSLYTLLEIVLNPKIYALIEKALTGDRRP